MFTLHHCVSARSFRPLWMLEELGLPYELKMWPFPPRALAPDFIEVNLLGTVPVLEDGPVRMTESAAMCQYLATRAPDSALAVDWQESDYASWLNWLHLGEATLTFPQTLVLRYTHFEPIDRRHPQVVDDYARWFMARVRGLDAALQDGREYLCAGRFTAADVSVGYALLLAQHLGLTSRMKPAVLAYWQRLQDRPGYQRAMAAQHQAALAQGVPTTPAPDTRP
jgi:glutathione S-transferase